MSTKLTAFQYLAHIQAIYAQPDSGSDRDFYLAALKYMRTNPDEFAKIQDDTGKETLEEMLEEILSNPDQFQIRKRIATQRVFGQGLVSRYREQITVSAQAVQSGRNVGG